MSKNITSRLGFTLIELIIVIGIISIMAYVSVTSYMTLRQSASIDVQTDLAISYLRELKAKSQNINNPSCLGFKLEIGEKIKQIATPYGTRFLPCDVTPSNIQEIPISDIDLEIDSFITSPQNENSTSLYILYSPPKGQILVFSNSDEDPLSFQKIQIKTKIQNKENNSYITVLNSGILEKEYITNSETN